MKLPIVILAALVCGACDLRVDLAGNPIVPTAGPGSTTITNTNTNTNTNDRSDTATAPPGPPSGGGNGSTVPLPLPTYGEAVTRNLAAANPALVARSCQDTMGETAWEFLDLVVRTLRSQDQRWGYLCKDSGCLTFGRDVIAYKATAAETGLWIVDVIQSHCAGPGDPPTAAQWLVLPFDTVRPWAAARKAGIFP